MADTSEERSITDQVRRGYGAIAANEHKRSDEDKAAAKELAKAFGYSDEDLADLPEESNMGLSCGNPLAIASLNTGEVVLDLGCGGGFDVFQAARKVGPTGKSIGLDMTDEMLNKARATAERRNYTNVEFVKGEITNMPIESNSVDCIISNCVINLVPDKNAAFREMYRVLKPGGRVAISDVLLKKQLPEGLTRDVLAFVGCVAGAVPAEDYRKGLEAAGFAAIDIRDGNADLNSFWSSADSAAATSCCQPAVVAPEPSSGKCCSGGGSGGGSCGVSSSKPAAESAPYADALSAAQVGSYEELRAKYKEIDLNEYIMSAKIFSLKAAPMP